MALNTVWDLEWYNQNSHRLYPLMDGVSSKDTTNTFKLPTNFLVDLSWNFTRQLNVSLFYVYSIELTSKSIIVELGYLSDIIGIATINISTFSRNTTYVISGTGDHYDSVGTLTVGSIESILTSGITKRLFTQVTAQLSPNTLHGIQRGVISIGSSTSIPLTGDVLLNVGANVRIDQAVIDNVTYLTFNAVSTNGLVADCADCGDTIETKDNILTLNGITPDENGNFTITGDDCVQIQPLEHGIKFIDFCSQPCCGCTELEAVKDGFAILKAEVDVINTVSSNLAGELSALSVNLISSQVDGIRTNVETMVNLMQTLLDDALSKTDCNQPCD